MNILIIHQNFPGQYKHLSPALVRRGDRVVALTPKVKERSSWQGVDIVPYKIVGSGSKEIHSWLRDLETKGHPCRELFQCGDTTERSGVLSRCDTGASWLG